MKSELHSHLEMLDNLNMELQPSRKVDAVTLRQIGKRLHEGALAWMSSKSRHDLDIDPSLGWMKGLTPLLLTVARYVEVAERTNDKIVQEVAEKLKYDFSGSSIFSEGEAVDRSVLRILNEADISPFVLRYLEKHDVDRLEEQLNDVEDSETVMNLVADMVFLRLAEEMPEYDGTEPSSTEVEVWLSRFMTAALSLKSIPIRGDETRLFPFLLLMEGYEDEEGEQYMWNIQLRAAESHVRTFLEERGCAEREVQTFMTDL